MELLRMMMALDSPLFLPRFLRRTSIPRRRRQQQPYIYNKSDTGTMTSTPADVKEYPNSYVFVIDMPGLKSGDIQVQVEDDDILHISGERKIEEEIVCGAKYVRMERRVGKLTRKFALPKNADMEAITAVCQDGVLTVTVQKLSQPPEPKRPKIIQVLKIAN